MRSVPTLISKDSYSLRDNVWQASAKLSEVARDLKEISALQQHATSVSKAQKEIARLKQEMTVIESELLASGSAKSVSTVEEELSKVTAEQ